MPLRSWSHRVIRSLALKASRQCHTEVTSEMSEEISVSGTKVITLSAGTFTFYTLSIELNWVFLLQVTPVRHSHHYVQGLWMLLCTKIWGEQKCIILWPCHEHWPCAIWLCCGSERPSLWLTYWGLEGQIYSSRQIGHLLKLLNLWVTEQDVYYLKVMCCLFQSKAQHCVLYTWAAPNFVLLLSKSDSAHSNKFYSTWSLSHQLW